MSVTPSGSPESPSKNSSNHTSQNRDKETSPKSAYQEYVSSEKKGWVKYAAGGTVAALVATAAVLFARGGGEEDPIDTPRKPSESAPVTPGPSPSAERPSPSATPTERVPELEQQRQLFERLQVPTSAVSAEELEAYKDADPNALDLYKGVNGGEGLYPGIDRTLIDHNLSFGALTTENLEDALNRNDEIYTGFYLDVVDGKLTKVPNTKLMEDGIWRSTLSKKKITEFSKDNGSGSTEVEDRQTPIHIAAAGLLVFADDSEPTIRLAADLVNAQGRVAKFRQDNPDDKTSFEGNPTSAVDMISSAYAFDVSINESNDRLFTAERLAKGEIQSITLPNFGDSRIVRVHEQERKTADGKTELNVLGVTLIGKESVTNKPFVVTLALVPAEHDFKYDTATKKFTLIEVPANDPVYHAMLVKKTYPSN